MIKQIKAFFRKFLKTKEITGVRREKKTIIVKGEEIQSALARFEKLRNDLYC